MGRHFFVVLAGNGVGGPFRTLFKHASTLDKVFSVGHWAPPCGVPIRFGRYTLRFAAGSNHRVATWVLAPFPPIKPAGFSLPFADRGLLLLTRSFAMLLGN